MADDNFKSLLSPDKSWYDVARGAFGGVKKQQRSRRAVMGLLFGLDLWESNKRAKIEKNLQELEDQKVLELAKLQKNFDKQIELIEVDDAIKASRNGYKGYYDSQAEDIFNERMGADAYLYSSDLKGNKELLKRKMEVKEQISKELYNAHQERMKGVVSLKDEEGKDIDFIRTKEAYFKPYNDYFKAQKAKLNSPSNKSVVHSLISKIPGLKPDTEQLDKDISNSKNLFMERAATRKELFSNPSVGYQGMYEEIDRLSSEDDNIVIEPTMISEIVEGSISEEQMPFFIEDVRSRRKDGKITVGTVTSELNDYITLSRIKSRQNEYKEFDEDFIQTFGTKEQPKNNLSSESWQRQRDIQEAKFFGFEMSQQQKIKAMAEDMTDIVISMNDRNITEEERDKIVRSFQQRYLDKIIPEERNELMNKLIETQSLSLLSSSELLKAGSSDVPAVYLQAVRNRMGLANVKDLAQVNKLIEDFSLTLENNPNAVPKQTAQGYDFTNVTKGPIFNYFTDIWVAETIRNKQLAADLITRKVPDVLDSILGPENKADPFIQD